jgi:putative Mg2+ transporter-C (MgtC) family protein
MNPDQQAVFVDLGEWSHVLRMLVRLAVAAVLGGLVGLERQEESKSAGLRTHMLVALGAAMFILVPLEMGMKLDDLSRVVQGLTMGIGFLGAGTIFKMEAEKRVKGLTTAATIWVTATVGMAVGFGMFWPALIAVGLAWVILFALHGVEAWLTRHGPKAG